MEIKKIVALVKPFRAQAVLEAISDLDIETVLVSEAKGYGRQKDKLPLYRGSEYNHVYLPKIEITLMVPSDRVEEVIERVSQVARTGRIGDGKILVFPVIAEIEF